MKDISIALGDAQTAISEEQLNIRMKALRKLFDNLLIKHKDATGYYENLLNKMLPAENLLLFLKLSRWLSNQSKETECEILTLFEQGKLSGVFEDVLSELSQELLIKSALRKSIIREVFPQQLFPEIASVNVPVGVIHQESHHANHADMLYVCGIAKCSGAKRIFEFGTYRGQTTCGLAAVCKDAQVYTLNLPPEDDPRYAPFIGMYIARSPDRDRITQIFADSRTFDTAPYRESMNYIFIDGDHSYEGVKNDTEKALQLLKPGGVIVWHDYAAKSPGVLKYLAEFSRERPLFRLRETCLAVYVDGLNPETAQLPPMDVSLEEQEYGDDLS